MSTEFINDQWRLPNAWNGWESNVNKQSNYSMSFNANDSIAVNGTSLQFSGSTSFALWFKMDGSITSSVRNMIGKGLEPNLSFFIRVNDLNNIPKIRFQIQESGGAYVSIWDSSSPTVTADVWHHVVGVFDVDNDQLKLYYDGTEVSGSPVSLGGATNIKNVNSDLKIGVYDNNFYDFYGQIDGVSIFDYALSSSQITTLYGSSSTGIGNPMAISGGGKPVFYAPLGDQDAFNGANYLVPNSSLKDYVFGFNGSNGYVDYGYTALTAISGGSSTLTTSMTISIWFKLNNATSEKGLIYFGDLNNNYGGFTIRHYASKFNFLRGSSHIITGGYSFTDTTSWHNMTLVYDPTNASNCYLYIDGSDTGVTFNASVGNIDFLNSNLSQRSLIIGTYYNTSYIFNGEMSNAQIFNTALPATGSNSVETLYNNGSPLTSMTGFTSLQGWWKLDASDTYDSSTGTWTIEDHAGSNDGTSSGMTQANLVVSDLSFKTSYSPFALDFDGTNHLGGAGYSIFNLQTISYSIWFKRTGSLTGTSVLMTRGQSSNIGWTLWLSNDILIAQFADGDSASDSYFNSRVANYKTAIPDNTWGNVIATFDGTNQKIYVNGQLLNTYSKNAAIDYGLSNIFYIGQRANGASNFVGEISNPSIWNTALTSAQVTEIYNQGVPSNLNNHSAYSNLVSWWQLGNNSSWVNPNWTVLDEVTANGNNITSTNMGESDIVDGVGSYANGLSSGMGGDEVIGDAPYSSSNSLSVNMDVLDRSTDVPS